MRKISQYPAKPFVKWAGGKSKLLADISCALPRDLLRTENVTYVEPFVGGGAVLFWILQEYPNITRAVISDINAELICTYRVIKTDVESLIAELKRMQGEYLVLDESGRKEYFLTRREQFNARNNSELETASLFIFLNRTCFNGLYRVNSKGLFNVPHGRYSNPKICDENTLRSDSKVLQRVEILCGDFSQTEAYASKNVIYYLDPPYRPLTKTSAFTSYTQYGFDDMEQKRLRNFCEKISLCKSSFVESNSDPHNIDETDTFFDRLYRKFCIKRVTASRMINSKGSRRGNISEIIISNTADVY